MKLQWLKASFAALLLWSLLLNSLPVKAQGEIVTSEDISGGSSVFVFRKSSKAPQAKFAPKAKPKRGKVEKAETRKKFDVEAKKVTPQRKKITAKVTATPKPTPKPSPGKPTPKPTPIKTMSPEDASNAIGVGAEIYLERGEVDKAIGGFQEAIKLYSANTLAKEGLSEALTVKGEKVAASDGFDYAIPYYEKAVANNPNNAVALARLGAAYEELEDDAKAFEYYQKAVAANPNLTTIYAPLGIGYYQRGEIEKADQLLTKAVAVSNDDYQTQYLLGLIHYKKNRDEQAIAAFKRTLELKNDFAEAHYFLGEVYDRNKRDNEAFEQYNEAVKDNPKYAEAWFDLGAAYFNKERYQDAINAYQKAVQFNNANYEAHANLADVYRVLAYNTIVKNIQDEKLRNELYGKAEGSYRTATDLAENNPKAKEDRTGMAELYNKYGFVLGRLLKWNSAIAALNKSISYNPDATDYTNLGWAYYNASQVDARNKQNESAKAKLEQGRDFLQKAVAMDKNSKAAYMNLGVTQNELGDYAGAIDSMKKCLSLQPDWFLALNELGYAYRGTGDLGEAVKNFKRASEIAEKKLSGAKSELDKAIGNAQVTNSLYNWATTEVDRGNEKEARKVQDKLRKYNPNMANAIEAQIINKIKNKASNEMQKRNPLNKIRLPY
jgi:tetratricopeptide (TPR) repeat protein